MNGIISCLPLQIKKAMFSQYNSNKDLETLPLGKVTAKTMITIYVMKKVMKVTLTLKKNSKSNPVKKEERRIENRVVILRLILSKNRSKMNKLRSSSVNSSSKLIRNSQKRNLKEYRKNRLKR